MATPMSRTMPSVAPHIKPKPVRLGFMAIDGRNLENCLAAVSDVRVVKSTDAIFHLVLKSAREIVTAKERGRFAIDNEAFAIATPWHEIDEDDVLRDSVRAQQCTDVQWLIAQCCMMGKQSLFVPELNVMIMNC